MLRINFYPDSDLQDFSRDISEYQNIWETDGELIVKVWEKLTKFIFKETFINAILIDRISHSHPLSLRYNYPINQKKSVLVHELGHRILHGRVILKIKRDTVLNHKHLYLKLYDVFLELYGEEFTKEAIAFDNQLSLDYKKAWDWVLQFTKEERQIRFEKVVNGDISQLN
jgi:hypothetical protein